MRAPWFRVRFVPAATRFRLPALAIVAAALFAVVAAGAFALTGSSAVTTGGRGHPHGSPNLTRVANRSAAPDTTSNPDILAPPDVIVGESDGHVDLTVRLADQSPNTVSVHYATADSTATSFGAGCPYDYIAASGTLNFAPGETSKTVPVQLIDCPAVEGFEAFTFNLDMEHNGVITRASSRVSIVDNDTIVATPKLFVRDVVIDEKDGSALVSVLLGGTAGQASNSTVTVDYATADGTASAGSDYTTKSGTLTFAPGETAKTVAVPITDDVNAEGQESFVLNLGNPNNATIATGTGAVSIGASDAPTSTNPDIRAPADLILGEADGFIDLPVTLSVPSPNTVSVNYSTLDSTAASFGAGCPYDYMAVSDTLNFAPGETTKVVRVQVLDCPEAERFEAFTFNLDTEHNGAITRASSRISIVDNDTIVATPRLFVRDAVVDEKDGFALLSVLLGGTGSQASNSTVTVDYATANGTANAGSDYSAVSGTLNFAPGETTKMVRVQVLDRKSVV